MRFLRTLSLTTRGCRVLLQIVALVLVAMLGFPPLGRAQQPAPLAQTEQEVIQELLKRLQKLEARVLELEAERGKPAAPVVAPSPAPPAPSVEEPAREESHMGSRLGPSLNIRGFTDVTFRGSNQTGATTSFAVGQFNLFVTSQLSEKFNFLSEIVFEAGDDNVFIVDVERLLLQYSHNDYFNFAVGRYHTAIGYYNTAYHHSTWLQTAIGRPFLFAFEDEGGILPIHEVGASISGRLPSGSLGLHYIVEVGNGRASRTPLDEAIQNVVDENNRKAVNVAFFARPQALRGLQTGFSVYHDRLAPDAMPKISRTILAAHVVFARPNFEWLNEALVVRHAPKGNPRVFNTPGFYTQISRRFGSYRPYLRYEYVNAPVNEPVFSDVGLRHGPSVGLRYEPIESVAFKLQYDRVGRRNLPGMNILTTQFAFTF